MLDHAGVSDFILAMEREHGFGGAELRRLFGQVRLSRDVLNASAAPAEAQPWRKYRAIFLTDARIRRGRKFLKRHRAALLEAERRFGTPPEIVTAILGVETDYGRNTGRHKVLEALATLAFYGPSRNDFFRKELEQFLLLARGQGIDPLSLRGSYAGAMGIPQFISSSYRNYAIDFNEDGRTDIWDDPEDAIGSVANYLGRHGWIAGDWIAVRAQPRDGGPRDTGYSYNGLKPDLPLQRIERMGLALPPGATFDMARLATVLRLDAGDRLEYWLGLDNFFVITRYNHSHLYALAIFLLGNEIAPGESRDTGTRLGMETDQG